MPVHPKFWTFPVLFFFLCTCIWSFTNHNFKNKQLKKYLDNSCRVLPGLIFFINFMTTFFFFFKKIHDRRKGNVSSTIVSPSFTFIFYYHTFLSAMLALARKTVGTGCNFSSMSTCWTPLRHVIATTVNQHFLLFLELSFYGFVLLCYLFLLLGHISSQCLMSDNINVVPS